MYTVQAVQVVCTYSVLSFAESISAFHTHGVLELVYIVHIQYTLCSILLLL